jgi:hypothetical protein
LHIKRQFQHYSWKTGITGLSSTVYGPFHLKQNQNILSSLIMHCSRREAENPVLKFPALYGTKITLPCLYPKQDRNRSQLHIVLLRDPF